MRRGVTARTPDPQSSSNPRSVGTAPRREPDRLLTCSPRRAPTGFFDEPRANNGASKCEQRDMNIESSFEANVRAAEAGASPCRMAGRKKATAGSTAFAAGANGESRCNGPLGLLMSLASGLGTDSSSMRTGANGWARASFAGRPSAAYGMNPVRARRFRHRRIPG
ncbi:hypothetical protein EGY16_24305 [Burkholderia pseudomallei]|nr:hypothetical protein EGY16_24305 [Burkholderia pseudomallei]